MLGTALAPAAASVAPERAALQARVDAVRAALAAPLTGDALAAPLSGDTLASPDAAWLLAQAANWTNWPKWSKWSTWANK